MSFCCVVTLTWANAEGEHGQPSAANKIAQHHGAPKCSRRTEPYINEHPLLSFIVVAFDRSTSDQDPLLPDAQFFSHHPANCGNTAMCTTAMCTTANKLGHSTQVLDGAFLAQIRFLRNRILSTRDLAVDRPMIKLKSVR